IRDKLVTGVQTCALPIYSMIGAIVHAAAPQSIQVSIRIVPSDVLAPAAFDPRRSGFRAHEARAWNASKAKRRLRAAQAATRRSEIGRASCRERVEILMGG